jgi:hypothetical protein
VFGVRTQFKLRHGNLEPHMLIFGFPTKEREQLQLLLRKLPIEAKTDDPGGDLVSEFRAIRVFRIEVIDRKIDSIFVIAKNQGIVIPTRNDALQSVLARQTATPSQQEPDHHNSRGRFSISHALFLYPSPRICFP